MRNNTTKISSLRWALAALLLVAGTAATSAFPLTTYAPKSALADGRWVKVSVASSGIHRLSPSTLRSWGFSDPSKVKVYGYGACRLPDAMTASTYLDDLPQVASELAADGTIYFYASGPVSWVTSGSYYRPAHNPFTTEGYYFLCETDDPRTAPVETGRASAISPATTFYSRLYHEQELVSPGRVGHLLVGEDFKYTPSRSFDFTLTDAVKGDDSQLQIEVSFVARTLLAGSRIYLSANGTALPEASSDAMTYASDSHSHGQEAVTRKKIAVTSDKLTVGITFKATTTVTAANLNYIAINYPRNLSLIEPSMPFNSSSSQLSLKAKNADVRVWDITTPSLVRQMRTAYADGRLIWTNEFSGNREYIAWTPGQSFPEPAFVGTVANQNLHGLEAYDMVIFSPAEWASQAERLAQFHRDRDGMKVLVANPPEVYNEFASGSPDANAFRKMLKTMWDRQKGSDTPLRYALFMGRVTYDNRRLTTDGRALRYPTLPAWFTDKGLHDNDSFTTDDVMGFLEDNSGTSMGRDKLCVAVGRLPVTSTLEATRAVDKIIDYSTKSLHGNWRNTILLIADDEDYGQHMDQTEYMYQNMLHSSGGKDVFYKKIYIDAYEKVGSVYPQARTDMFRALDEGVLWWNFIGHANPTSWTHDGLMTYADINSLYLKRWPFVYAATCDFLRWDSPSISAAEILWKNPDGGVIGAFSAVRPVYIADNENLNRAFGEQIFCRDDDGRYRTVGDICMLAKNNFKIDGVPASNTNKLRFVLLADPAMRMVIPSCRVEIDQIDGVALDPENPPTIKARQDVVLSGRVLTIDGQLDETFDGMLVSTLYDAEYSTTSNGNGDKGEPVTFDQQGGRLFAGNTPVKNGRFEIKVSMPTEVADNYRPAAINLYAYSSDGREASSVCRDFYIFGVDENAPEDNEPPTIKQFYLNHSGFASGETVNPSPVVVATITDNKAVNLSTAGIGHHMSLQLDNGAKTYSDVSDYFTPFSDGTPGGTIVYPLSDLSRGNHSLRLRVWDNASNSASAEIDFFVEHGLAPRIFDVYSDANPATSQANFYLRHDRPDGDLTVTIEVFNLMGRKVWEQTRTGRADMFLSFPIAWDLNDLGGARVARGIYLYRATVSDPDSGEHTSTASKKIAVAGFK